MTTDLLEPSRSSTDAATALYAKAIENSKRVRWDIERDVIRGRSFDHGKKWMPDGLSKLDRITFLQPEQKRLLSQIQGRTYANMFGMIERYIGTKTIELGRGHGLGDQVACEALVRMADEELKHQALFRRLETMMAAGMPAGYMLVPQPNEVASFVLGKGNWAVLALTLDIELFSLSHYRSSIEPDEGLSELWKDVFRFHWIEESQHVTLDELEWRSVHAGCSAAEREQGVTELIELVGAVDGLVLAQAEADANYFFSISGTALDAAQAQKIRDTLRQAYRWQYITSGAVEPRFASTLTALTTEAQMQRIGAALGPIVTDSGT